MENPDLGHVRYFHDHSGCDRDQCGIPDTATRVRCNSSRRTMGAEYLCFIVGSHNACLWLFSGSFWDQARLSFWTGCICNWLIPVWTCPVVRMVDRGARPAGIRWWGCTTVRSCTTLSGVPAQRAGDRARVLWHCPGVRAGSRSDSGRLVSGCQSLAADFLYQYPYWNYWRLPGFALSP